MILITMLSLSLFNKYMNDQIALEKHIVHHLCSYLVVGKESLLVLYVLGLSSSSL